MRLVLLSICIASASSQTCGSWSNTAWSGFSSQNQAGGAGSCASSNHMQLWLHSLANRYSLWWQCRQYKIGVQRWIHFWATWLFFMCRSIRIGLKPTRIHRPAGLGRWKCQWTNGIECGVFVLYMDRWFLSDSMSNYVYFQLRQWTIHNWNSSMAGRQCLHSKRYPNFMRLNLVRRRNLLRSGTMLYMQTRLILSYWFGEMPSLPGWTVLWVWIKQLYSVYCWNVLTARVP